MKHRNATSILDGSAQRFNRGLRGFQACKMKGTPPPIYREGVWMVLEGEYEGLLRKGEWLEAWLRLDHGEQMWLLAEPVCTSDHLPWFLASVWNRQGKRDILL